MQGNNEETQLILAERKKTAATPDRALQRLARY